MPYPLYVFTGTEYDHYQWSFLCEYSTKSSLAIVKGFEFIEQEIALSRLLCAGPDVDTIVAEMHWGDAVKD